MIKKNNTAENDVNITVKVLGVREVKEGRYSFDMVANGIKIYGCWYNEGVKDGKEYSIVSFPSNKGKDDKYYNVCYFKITDTIKESIVNQISSLLS